jgi:amino-acid N-acetyltransferase
VPTQPTPSTSTSTDTLLTQSEKLNLVQSILDPVHRATALVKLQGPFTDVQLQSIARGLVYLEKLGLVSVIVLENERDEEDDRAEIIEQTLRFVTALEAHGAKARPILDSFVRLGPPPNEPDPKEHMQQQRQDVSSIDIEIDPPEAHALTSDLVPIRSALNAGEIPVVAPFALDSHYRSVRIDANDVLGALAQSMAQAGRNQAAEGDNDIDLTPMRLMIINREGGVPSYARSGYPHLLVNLISEFDHIHETFHRSWTHSHPTALSNLSLARTCLSYMPPTSSAVMVSHRSPSSLIANLITNRPAVSSSLPYALLQGNRKLTPHTPTLLRRGLPMQVLRTMDQLDRSKMTQLLERSFGRTLRQEAFYDRLEETLDYVIVAGDYAGAAIVTREASSSAPNQPIQYLDKFAVDPSHQGDGTVDFLWVALHDESYGLGHPFSANPNGGRGGQGEGHDLVWRSRVGNPVNKWYFERSSGHLRCGDWILFWCDGEKRLRTEQTELRTQGRPLSFVEHWEGGRIERWKEGVMGIPSCWQ